MSRELHISVALSKIRKDIFKLPWHLAEDKSARSFRARLGHSSTYHLLHLSTHHGSVPSWLHPCCSHLSSTFSVIFFLVSERYNSFAPMHHKICPYIPSSEIRRYRLESDILSLYNNYIITLMFQKYLQGVRL